jgi:hypothetical protein
VSKRRRSWEGVAATDSTRSMSDAGPGPKRTGQQRREGEYDAPNLGDRAASCRVGPRGTTAAQNHGWRRVFRRFISWKQTRDPLDDYPGCRWVLDVATFLIERHTHSMIGYIDLIPATSCPSMNSPGVQQDRALRRKVDVGRTQSRTVPQRSYPISCTTGARIAANGESRRRAAVDSRRLLGSRCRCLSAQPLPFSSTADHVL